MNFVQDTLPNLISRAPLEPYRYKHTSRQGFPRVDASWTSSSAAPWRWTTAHISCPFMPCIGEWWWLIGKSGEGRKMGAAIDESISTLKSPDCNLSFSYLPPGAKNHSNLPSPPPFFFFFFWKYLLSLSVSSPLHFFFIPQCQGFHTENTPIFTCFHSPE